MPKVSAVIVEGEELLDSVQLEAVPSTTEYVTVPVPDPPVVESVNDLLNG